VASDTPEFYSTSALVQLADVGRTYLDGKVVALSHVSLSIARSEFLAITGRSGCGKSTLLHILGGLDRPTSGEVWLEGNPLSQVTDLDRWRSEKVGFVFQTYYLLPNLTAEENVQLPMFGRGKTDRERVARARELLSLVGLADRGTHLPWQLSAGQRQRVAIARALVNQPSLLLADEPTGSLDSRSGHEVLELIQQCRDAMQMAVVMVTHDDGLAQRAQRMITLSDGQIVGDRRTAVADKMDNL
jgi:ABC-type lipoprotein export system ATPase subunit